MQFQIDLNQLLFEEWWEYEATAFDKVKCVLWWLFTSIAKLSFVVLAFVIALLMFKCILDYVVL